MHVPGPETWWVVAQVNSARCHPFLTEASHFFQVPVTSLCFFSLLPFPVALTLKLLSVPLTLFLQYVKHVSYKVSPDEATV